MSLFDNILVCTLTGADPENSLSALIADGVSAAMIHREDDLTLRFCCDERDRTRILALCEKKGDSIRFHSERGWKRTLRHLYERKVCIAGLLLLGVLTLYLPTRVFFFRVEGNDRIPAGQILEAAAECGIRFGVSRRDVRSEKMKNALLAALPDLKWAGINTAGCTGIISVREGVPQTEQPVSGGISSIAACRDGFITSCTVTRGNALCAPGQAVRKGQLLISGYTDCGICIRVTEAQGEIYAQTRHTLDTKTPREQAVRLTQQQIRYRYSILLGKKRINLWKGSGISDPTCGRMYEEYYITLPGGFRLPVALSRETLTQWETSPALRTSEELEFGMKAFARNTVLGSMVAGKILREEQILLEGTEGFSLVSRFLCEEMIGRVITEEIGETNGKTD